MKKILITGASGFVGSHLVEDSLKRSYNVYAGIRKSSSTKYLQDPNIQHFYMDFNNPSELRKQLAKEQFNFVIHNAGATSAPSADVLFKVNHEYTKTLIDILLETSNNLEKFVFMSSLAAYGPADFTSNSILNHESTPHPVTDYGRSKLKAESYIRSKANLPFLIFRPTAIFGPRDKELLRVFKAVKSGIGAKIGSKPQYLSFIFVKDLSKMIIDALASPIVSESYFVSDGKTYEAKTFNGIIAKALNKNIISLQIPVALLKVVAGCNEIYSRISKKSSVLNMDKVNELKARNWACDINKQIMDFGFKPSTSLQNAVNETVSWYRENNWL